MFTSSLMKIKTSNPILRYGNFEMATYDDNYVIFRRVLNDESLLCIVNRDLNDTDIELNTNAHSVEIIYGDCTIELDSGKLKIKDLAENFGLIIKES